MKNQLFFAIFLSFTAIGVGQYAGQSSNMSAGGASGGSSGQIYDLLGPIDERNKKTKNKYEEFQGSPYIANIFLPSTMYYGDENLGQIFYRYNALNEEIEIKKTNSEDEIPRSLARDKEISILSNGKKMNFKTFTTAKNKTLNGYLITIIDGKTFDLYKRTFVKFTEGTPSTNSFVKAIPSRFSQFTEYYFQKDGVNRMDEIRLKNSQLLRLFNKIDKTKLKEFIKENDLNIKNEPDLIRVFDFLNK